MREIQSASHEASAFITNPSVLEIDHAKPNPHTRSRVGFVGGQPPIIYGGSPGCITHDGLTITTIGSCPTRPNLQWFPDRQE